MGQRESHCRPARPHVLAFAKVVARILRRQTNGRSDVSHQQRLGPTVPIPVGQHRRFHGQHDLVVCRGVGVVQRKRQSRAGHTAAVPVHRLGDVLLARQAADRLSRGEPCVGAHDQRSGRHDSGHSGGEGLRSGKPRDRALPNGKRSRGHHQQPRELALDVLLAANPVSQQSRGAGRVGLRCLVDCSS